MAPPPTLTAAQTAEEARIKFANLVSAMTGFDPRVLLAQYIEEGSPGDYPGYYNYGNMPDTTAATLGYPYKAGAYGFADYGKLKIGAEATSKEYKNLGLGKEKGKTIRQQLEDIQNSPWASSHYGYHLVQDFQADYPNVNVDAIASSKATNLTSGGQTTGPGVTHSITSAISGIFGGVEGLILQGFFVLIGLGLILVGLGLIAWTVMGRVGAPGIIGIAQSQMRIGQAGARIQESQRAATAREELRGQSIEESSRSARVRESQASRRIAEQRQARKLSERRLNVREEGVQRSGFEDRRFTNVRRDDRTATRNKPGKKASGAPKRK